MQRPGDGAEEGEGFFSEGVFLVDFFFLWSGWLLWLRGRMLRDNLKGACLFKVEWYCEGRQIEHLEHEQL